MDTPIQRLNKRWQALKAERNPHEETWKDVADYVVGYRGRHITDASNRRPVRNRTIINNTPKLANRTLASGLMAGITSPARPWFKLKTPDPALMEFGPVKMWLSDVERIMRQIYSQSNAYQSLHRLYGDLGSYAIAPLAVYENFDRVIHTEVYPVGSYAVSADELGRVNGFYREYTRTVAQLVERFGKDNVSRSVRNQYDNGNYEQSITVMQAIESDSLGESMVSFPIRSLRWESNATARDGESEFLSKSGFEEFPVIVPRWEVLDSDVYGTDCPGFAALGDAKALQLEERRKAQAIDKMVEPPILLPVGLETKYRGGSGFRPGERVFSDDMSQAKSLYDMNMRIDFVGQEIRETEFRIKRAFYEDLFLMLSNTDRRQITAREINERHEEKLLMLGPVLDRVHHEGLDPFVGRTFAIAQRNGVFPEPPEDLLREGGALTVQYTSVLAQAQQLAGISSIERTVAFAGELSAIWPAARHKVNASQAIDEFAEGIGVSPRIIRGDEDAQTLMEQEQQAEQAAQMAQAAPGVAQAAQTIGETNLPVVP